MEWSLQGYIVILGGGVFWATIFTVVSVYVYLKQQSMVAWAVAMLILFAAFGNALMGVGVWINLLHILIALSITGLFLLFLTKYRR